MNLKKSLLIEIPTISKSTPYWRALKICSLLFLPLEAVIVFALLLDQVTLTEFGQISLGLFVFWLVAPIFLRIKERALFWFCVVAAVLSILLFAFVSWDALEKSNQKQEPARITSDQ